MVFLAIYCLQALDALAVALAFHQQMIEFTNLGTKAKLYSGFFA
jgi:hypothetical protein